MSARRRSGDRGFTLVEVLISMVLGGTIAGVTVATLFTSMNAVEATGEQVAHSNDAALVSAYLYRDARAAGGAEIGATATGVVTAAWTAVAPSTDPWGGCTQEAPLVVRFGWVEHDISGDATSVVSTWAVDAHGRLVRRVCRNGGSMDVIVARHVGEIEATCAPDPACGPVTEAVSLAVSGSGTRSPYQYTLTVALRPHEPQPPSTAGSAPLALVVLGDPDGAPCPSLSLSGAGTLAVAGDAMIDDGCGGAPVGGDQTLLRSTGQTNLMSDVADPYAALPSIAADCSSGTNPSPLGASPSATSVVVYPQPVTIGGPVDLAPGRYVFCGGVTVVDGGQLTGDDVVIEIRGGPFVVDDGADVDLDAPSSGDLAHLLLRSTAAHPITIAHSQGRVRLGGVVDAPRSAVSVTGGAPVTFGAIVAATLAVAGEGPVRVGLPMPELQMAFSELDDAQAGSPYGPTTLQVDGGTAPYSWSATGLPDGMTLSATGDLAGSPTAPGDAVVRITVVDATNASSSVDVALHVRPAPT